MCVPFNTSKNYPITAASFGDPREDIVERVSKWMLAVRPSTATPKRCRSISWPGTQRDDCHVTVRTPIRPASRGWWEGSRFSANLSTEQEKQSLDLGHFKYESILAVFAAVEPPGVGQPA